jgi:hypothetical protein
MCRSSIVSIRRRLADQPIGCLAHRANGSRRSELDENLGHPVRLRLVIGDVRLRREAGVRNRA